MLTAIAFLFAYLAACALSLLRHPIYGLVAYLGVFYMHPPTRWWSYALPDIRWSFLAAAVTFAGLMVHRKRLSPSKPLTRNGVFWGLIIFILWLFIQSIWALDAVAHAELLNYYFKFAIAAGLIYKCIDDEKSLRILLWANVLGCFAFGWYAFVNYEGGRFQEFGGPGFSDANFAGIQAVTGIFAAATIMLAGHLRERIAVTCIVPFLVNGLVTTMSRSSFLALLVGGVAFIWFCPARFRRAAIVVGLAGVVGFFSLTNDQYWDRIGTIMFAGQEVEGVDTGSSRIVVWKAQAEMFTENVLGCGHRCTVVLSPAYLDDEYLTGPPGARARASHNTFMTMLVEQGVVGAALYLLFLLWIARTAGALKRRSRGLESSSVAYLAGAAAVLTAICAADMFVDYLKLEVRIWYIAVMMVIVRLSLQSIEAPADGTGTAKRSETSRPPHVAARGSQGSTSLSRG